MYDPQNDLYPSIHAMSGASLRMLRVFFPAGSARGTCCGESAYDFRINLKGASIMGKYVLGWILGVPVFVLVIIYVLFH